MTATTAQAKKDRQEQARIVLRAAGAECLKREDRFGDTKAGWWIDDVCLGPTNDPEYCVRVMNGGR